MSSLFNNKIITTAFLLIIISECDRNSYEKIEVSRWESYLEEISGKPYSLDGRHIIIIAYPSYCGSCLREIQSWNELIRKGKVNEYDLVLIMIDKSEVSVATFIQGNDIKLNYYIDKSGKVLNYDLVSSIPMRVVLEDRSIKMIHELGDAESFKKLL